MPMYPQSQTAASLGQYNQGMMQQQTYAAGPTNMPGATIQFGSPDLFSMMMGPRMITIRSGGMEEGPRPRMINLGALLTAMMNQDEAGMEALLTQLGIRPAETGFKKEDLDKNFFTAKFDKSKSAGLEEENKKCAICLSEFEDGDELRFLECCHRFHTECIDNWMKSKTTCPICKKDFKNFNAEGDDSD